MSYGGLLSSEQKRFTRTSSFTLTESVDKENKELLSVQSAVQSEIKSFSSVLSKTFAAAQP